MRIFTYFLHMLGSALIIKAVDSLEPVLRIRIRRIRMFLGLLGLDPDPDPLVSGMDPDPDPSIIKQKY